MTLCVFRSVEPKKRHKMQGNFVMLQVDDLRQVVTEIVEEVCEKRGLNERASDDETEWLTREEVCDRLNDMLNKLEADAGNHAGKKRKVLSKSTRWADAIFTPRKMLTQCWRLLLRVPM